MPSELTCSECGDTEVVELLEMLQFEDGGARLYYPVGEIDAGEEVNTQLLLNAERTWYENPSTGTAFCAPCFCEIPGTNIEKEDLGRLEDGSLHFDMGVDELSEQ